MSLLTTTLTRLRPQPLPTSTRRLCWNEPSLSRVSILPSIRWPPPAACSIHRWSVKNTTILLAICRRCCGPTKTFTVAEVFTGKEGRYVPVKETVQGCKEVLEGKYDHIPENYFYLKGNIEEVVQDYEAENQKG